MSRSDYWNDIESTVENMWSDYELESVDDAYDAIDQLADSAVIYTSEALKIMQHTANDDAFTDVGLEGCDSWSEVVTRAAYFAYKADLYDEAREWSEEDIFAARKVFRCMDCGDVTPDEEKYEDEDDADQARCDSCHADWAEELAVREAEENESAEDAEEEGE